MTSDVWLLFSAFAIASPIIVASIVTTLVSSKLIAQGPIGAGHHLGGEGRVGAVLHLHDRHLNLVAASRRHHQVAGNGIAGGERELPVLGHRQDGQLRVLDPCRSIAVEGSFRQDGQLWVLQAHRPRGVHDGMGDGVEADEGARAEGVQLLVDSPRQSQRLCQDRPIALRAEARVRLPANDGDPELNAVMPVSVFAKICIVLDS